MKNTVSGTSFKKRAGIAAFVIIGIHIALCCFAMLAPKSIVHSTRLTSLYDRLIILGPFFQEARISSTPRVFVSYKTNNEWSKPVDHSIEDFNYYRAHPWRYDKLHTGDFVRSTSSRVSKFQKQASAEIKKSRAFRELNEFILQEYIKQPVDSINVLYAFNVYLADVNAYRLDTVFQYTYRPSDVAAAKRRD